MSERLMCSQCGRTFQAGSAPAPLCPDCRAAAVSEQPMPAPPRAPDGIQSGMRRGRASLPSSDAEPGDIRKPAGGFDRLGATLLLLFLAVLLAAFVTFILVCA